MDDDKEKYWRWLEEMWDVQKFDVHGSTEREEKRKEDILEVFEDLGEITQRRVEAPHFRLGNPPDEKRDERSPEAP
jgi:hypothetical protein